jgi:hypothetical protein
MTSPIATFDVGGKIYRFLKDIANEHKQSLFYKVISGEDVSSQGVVKLENNVHFFDRNPTYFEHVLD